MKNRGDGKPDPGCESSPCGSHTAPAEEVEMHTCLNMMQRMYLFQDLTARELQKIQKISYVLDCPANRILIKEGATSDLLYMILEGQVAVYRDQVHLATLSRGEHFGEMALLNKFPRSATVMSTRDCSLLVIEREKFFNLINNDESLGMKTLWAIGCQLCARLDSVLDSQAARQ